VIVLAWGLKENQIRWQEAICWTLAFSIFFGAAVFTSKLELAALWSFVALLVVAALLLRVFGSDIAIPRL